MGPTVTLSLVIVHFSEWREYGCSATIAATRFFLNIFLSPTTSKLLVTDNLKILARLPFYTHDVQVRSREARLLTYWQLYFLQTRWRSGLKKHRLMFPCAVSWCLHVCPRQDQAVTDTTTECQSQIDAREDLSLCSWAPAATLPRLCFHSHTSMSGGKQEWHGALFPNSVKSCMATCHFARRGRLKITEFIDKLFKRKMLETRIKIMT